MSHLSPFTIDALDLGSLSPAERQSAQAHLAGCAECRAQQESAAALRERFRTQVLWRTLTLVLARGHRRWAWLLPMVLVPATALAALLLVLRLADVSDLATKGGPNLAVFARRSERVFAVLDGQRLQPGDYLRFVVNGTGEGFVLILSLDGSGHASVYYPFGGPRSAPLGAGRQELPGSIVLDDSEGVERLYALFSNEPLEAARLLRTLEREQRLAAPAPTVTVSLQFEKHR